MGAWAPETHTSRGLHGRVWFELVDPGARPSIARQLLGADASGHAGSSRIRLHSCPLQPALASSGQGLVCKVTVATQQTDSLQRAFHCPWLGVNCIRMLLAGSPWQPGPASRQRLAQQSLAARTRGFEFCIFARWRQLAPTVPPCTQGQATAAAPAVDGRLTGKERL